MDTNTSDSKTQRGDSVVRPSEALGARIKAARGELSQRQLADMVGVHFNTIGKLERGHPPDTQLLLAIASATNTSAAWLLLGSAYPRSGYTPPEEAEETPPDSSAAQRAVSAASPSIPKSLKAIELGAYIYVPHFDVHASAGPGFFNDVENVVTMRPFEVHYVRGKLGISHDEIALINIVGRSYEPLLHSGDVTMLDRRDREALEGPHVIRLDGALLVKQLQRMPGRVLKVSSKNAEYESFDIAPNEDEQRDFEVVGRLRWAGITMN